ncbi:hypothetical protein NIES592_00755 [Fischerella major NIES-592]|uniref:Uncharacterized protein n=1 Tax=Fischerella major NIES-592 TaxID=210994 RepID=A0A1U7H4N6_9CYAN|nr:hypothetical protein NIES592_00755 [Fischerella major NIES-592]
MLVSGYWLGIREWVEWGECEGCEECVDAVAVREGVAVLDARCFMPGDPSTALAPLPVTIANPRRRAKPGFSKSTRRASRKGGVCRRVAASRKGGVWGVWGVEMFSLVLLVPDPL